MTHTSSWRDSSDRAIAEALRGSAGVLDALCMIATVIALFQTVVGLLPVLVGLIALECAQKLWGWMAFPGALEAATGELSRRCRIPL